MSWASTWGRRLAYGVIALAAVVAALYVALPPAKTDAEGAPDPILWARKPVVKALHHVGVPRPGGPHDWIPSAGSTETWESEKKDSTFETAQSAERMTWESRPVYRGVFWRAGMRFTVKVDRRGDAKDDPDRLRLWMKLPGGERTTVAEGGPGVPDVRTGLRRWRVDGYIPGDAVSYGYEEIDRGGRSSGGSSWSDD
jgi:hypothetical protein